MVSIDVSRCLHHAVTHVPKANGCLIAIIPSSCDLSRTVDVQETYEYCTVTRLVRCQYSRPLNMILEF